MSKWKTRAGAIVEVHDIGGGMFQVDHDGGATTYQAHQLHALFEPSDSPAEDAVMVKRDVVETAANYLNKEGFSATAILLRSALAPVGEKAKCSHQHRDSPPADDGTVRVSREWLERTAKKLETHGWKYSADELRAALGGKAKCEHKNWFTLFEGANPSGRKCECGMVRTLGDWTEA